MATLPGRLGNLLARDVMTTNVVVLKETDSIQKAISTLKDRKISGAPVVDDAGRLTGILSLSDLVQPSEETSASTADEPVPLAHGDNAVSWDLFEKADALDAESRSAQVGSRMTRRVASVSEDAPLVEVARAMCDGHWHRVAVVDQEGSLCGIASSMDIMAALVHTADEAV